MGMPITDEFVKEYLTSPDSEESRAAVLGMSREESAEFEQRIVAIASGEQEAPADPPPADAPPTDAPPITDLPPADAPPVVDAPPPVDYAAEARARSEGVAALEKSEKEFSDKVKGFDTIINAAKPDREMDPEAYDKWAEDRLEAVNGKAALITERQSALIGTDLTARRAGVAEAFEKSFYSTVDKIYSDFALPKLSVPFKTAEDAAKPFIQEIYKAYNGGKAEGITAEIADAAWDKYCRDPEFKKLVGTPPKDFETVTLIMEAREVARRNRGSLRGAVADVLSERGKPVSQLIADAEQRGREAGAREVLEKNDEAIRRASGAPKKAPIGGGSPDGSGEVVPKEGDRDSAVRYLEVWQRKATTPGYALTDVDEKLRARAEKILMGS